jgi:oxygen-dependent protoporphyrinogen oxidase
VRAGGQADAADRGDEVEVTYRGEPHRFDAAVLACPLPTAAEICPDRAAVLGPLNDAIGYTKCLTVAVGCSVEPESPAMLVELPRCEDEVVALLFLDHNKCSDRAPAGRGLIGCCWEAHAASAMFDASDEQIAKHTLATVLRVFPELGGKVEFTHVSRWARALPHTRIGAYRKIGEFNARLDPLSRIQFAGDYMSAAGQNTAVEFGGRAAENLERARVGAWDLGTPIPPVVPA